MKNWSTDLSKLNKNPEKLEIFKLESLINFGLDGEKLSEELLKKYWHQLNIDPDKKAILEKMLWPES